MLCNSDIATLKKIGNKRKGTARNKNHYKPYWTPDLQKLWDSMCEAEQVWLSFKGPLNRKSILRRELLVKRRQFDKQLRKSKRQYQVNQQDELLSLNQENQTKDFWKKIGKLGISNERKQGIPLMRRAENGDIETRPDTVLDHWKQSYESLLNVQDNRNGHFDQEFYDSIIEDSTTLEASPPDTDISCLNKPISYREVEDAVRHLHNGKAAGIDSIPSEVIQNQPCTQTLHKIINYCFENAVNPVAWKEGIINPVNP